MPNLLVTGILAILVSAAFLIWATMFVQGKRSGVVLLLLCIVMLLVGGGFGPPLLGIIVGATATKIGAPLPWWHAHLSRGTLRVLGALWPWSLAAALIAWLFLFPGSTILSYFYGVTSPNVVTIPLSLAFGFLAVTIFTGLARDSQRQADPRQAASRGSRGGRRGRTGARRA